MAKKGMVKGVGVFNEAEWQAEDDLRTLTRAIEIKKDPKRFKAAKAMAKKKLEEMAAISASDK